MKLQRSSVVKVSQRGAVNLPAKVLRQVGWKHGDDLWVTIEDGNRIVLSRRPDDIVAHFAGAFTDLYPDPEDTRRFLAEERASWDEFDKRLDD